MKLRKLFVILVFATCQQVLAFDPGEGPRPGSSLSTTVGFVSFVKIAKVDYPEGTLSEVLHWIRGVEIPEKYGVVVDASRLNLPETTKVKLVEKDITILKAASLVAEQIGAEILIQPGKILLVPKYATKGESKE
jgi:hypothetical protein